MNEVRELLFRGKRVENGEWVYGGIVHQTDNYGDEISDYRIIDGTETEDNDIGYSYIVDPVTVGQYTGLNDKKHRRIFEGDIVRTKYDRLCVVIWRGNSAVNCWDIYPLECKHRSPDKWDLWESKNLLVVGNIYDNPEMRRDAVRW